MFETIGKFSARFRYPIVVAWVALTLAAVFLAPSLSDVTISDQSGYLPQDEPSVVAAEMATEYFPEQAAGSQAILVVHSAQGAIRGEAAQAYLAELTGWLEGEDAPEALGVVLSPADPNLADRLTSEDGKVAMFSVGLHGSVEDQATVDALREVQSRLDAAPQGLAGYVTGSTAISIDYKDGVMESLDSTTLITIILVVIILLAIYRSLVAPIIPLATIGIAFLVSRGLVGWLTEFGWAVSSITEVVLVVLLFGAGTDYCLFLVSRFREFVADDVPGQEGAWRTVGRVGETITSSAGTVIVGMVALSFADMKLFATSGPSLALGVGIALLAGLTLTPALLAVMGRAAFWPGDARHTRRGGFWGKLAQGVTARPWLTLILTLALLLPLAVYGQGMPRNFDLLADLPEDMPSKAGFTLLSQSMGAGEMQPLDVILTEISDAHTPEGLAHIDAVTQELLAAEGVADVRSLTLPAGQGSADLADLLRVEEQLSLVLETIDDLRSQVEDPAAGAAMLADMDAAGGGAALAGFDTLRAYLDELGAAFPDLVGQADYQAAQDSLTGLEEALADGQQRLLVSNQLLEAANGVTQGLADQQAASAAVAVDDLEEALGQFSVVGDYLAGLVEAHPPLAEMDGYDEALAALDGIEAAADEIQQALLVSTQLDLMAQSIASMAAQLQDPAASEAMLAGQAGVGPEAADGLAVLDSYLQELGAAYPALADMPAFQTAREELGTVQAEVEALLQAQLLSNQLALVAGEMEAYALALEENPLALLPQPGEPSAAEQMGTLRAYLEGLGTAYPSLAATADYETALALVSEMEAGLETIDLSQVGQLIAGTQESLEELGAAFGGMSDTVAEAMPDEVYVPEGEMGDLMAFAPDLSPLAEALSAIGEGLVAAAGEAASEMPEATFVPEGMLDEMDALAIAAAGSASADPTTAVAESAAALEEELGALADALRSLGRAAAAELPDATYLPPETLLTDEAQFSVEPLLAEVDAFRASLEALAQEMAGREDGFFIPTALVEEEAGDEIDQLLDTYSTADGEVARLQVVLDDDPFSTEAMDTVATLRQEVSHASRGYVAGSTATNLDLQIVMDRDFVKVMLLVIGGILVVLVLLLRSLVAPVYMMLTILLSYGATMGLTRLVFDGLLGEGIAWFVPFLIFVVLVALGMDYNIFLMGRVKEEVALASARGEGVQAGNGTRAGIAHAVERTGGIITSAGIIMAGTFAAMMSSSLLGLVQLGFAVALGVLLDTFVIRTTLVPAIATLLGRWNWWPGRGPGGQL